MGLSPPRLYLRKKRAHRKLASRINTDEKLNNSTRGHIQLPQRTNSAHLPYNTANHAKITDNSSINLYANDVSYTRHIVAWIVTKAFFVCVRVTHVACSLSDDCTRLWFCRQECWRPVVFENNSGLSYHVLTQKPYFPLFRRFKIIQNTYAVQESANFKENQSIFIEISTVKNFDTCM